MKDLEKIFKDSLSNHEVPYDASAWSSLSSKMAVKPKPFFKKGWFYGAVAGAAIVVAGVTYVVNNNEIVIADNVVVNETPIKTNDDKTVLDNTSTVIALNENNNSETERAVISEESTSEHKVIVNRNEGHEEAPLQNNEEKNELASSHVEHTNGTNNNNNKETIIPLSASFTINETSICSGTSFTINLPLQKKGVNESLTIDDVNVPLKSRTIQYKTDKSGICDITYTVSISKTEKLSLSKQVNVTEIEEAEFQYSTTTEKGMPLTEFTSNSENVAWKIDGKVVSTSNTFKHLFMNKGTYEVTLEAKNENGCGTTTTESVYIESDYKLFAETGLILSSTDQRLNTFMPFALEEMDNPDFLLSVLDARTGEVLFTSNDASYKWDGTNRTTGNKLEAGSIVFWTVIINGNKYINGPIKGDVTIKN